MRYARGSQRFVFLGVAAAAILLGFQALAGDVRSAKPQSDGKPVEKSKPVSFHSAVLPILQANCQGCHQPAKASGKLDLTSFKNLLTAGESGSKAIVPGKPDESYLLEQITPAKGETAMPKERPPLSDTDIALVRRWIKEGAKDDTPADTSPPIDAAHPPVYSGPPVITSIDWSPNGELLAVAGFHEVLLHKAEGAGSGDPRTTLVARLVGMAERIESVRFSPDGTKLAATGGRPARSGEVQIWGVAEKKLLVSVPVTNDSVFGASWSRDGKKVAFGCTDKSVRVINAESGAQVLYQSSHDDWVLGTAFSVDGSHLVSVGRDMSAKLIDVATQRFVDNITSITPGALKGGIQSVVSHPLRDEILFGGSDGTPRIYRMQRTTARQIGDDANLLWELPPLSGRVFSVDMTRDGRTIAAGSSLDGHGNVHVYRIEAAPKIPDPIQAILNKPLQARSAAETAMLHKHFEQGVQTLARLEVAETGVYAVALSPNGDRVAAAGGDGTVRLFDTKKSALVGAFVPVEIKKDVVKQSVAELRKDAGSGAADTALRDAGPKLPADALKNLVVEPMAIQMDGPARYAQVVVMAELASGAKIDVTRHATFAFSAPVAKVNSAGCVTPTQNGHGMLVVSFGAKSANVDVRISGLEKRPVPDFIRDVAPAIARAGCNAGTCHGAQQGKNGFKLSLRGYDPVLDVRALTDDLASRRVNVASPSQSLMLLKPTAAVPHTGGQVIQPDSVYYETLHDWIAAGAHLNLTSPRVASIKVMPVNPVIETVGARQQVRVVATYTDGGERDVTREAFVESGNTDVVKTVPGQPGLLESLRRGEAAALVRYEGKYAATTLTVMGDRTGFVWENPPANNHIDELAAAKLKRTKTGPSPLTNDYEFVRRVYLDLTGLPPTPEQVQSFVDDKRETKLKRDALVDKLIGSDDYIDFWTNKWADLLMVNGKFLGLEGATALRNWIRGELAANTPYDQFARKILTASGSTKANPPASYFKTLRTPQALMENTTHLFLATRFNCNKCHDHPFERWTQDQYYHLAAYFAQVQLSKDPASGDSVISGSAVEAGQPLYEIVADSSKTEVTHVRTGAVSAPAFPFDCKHEVKKGASRRDELAAWVTSSDNPYFAKSYVNRLWGYLTGRGIIEPLDDIRAGNPPSNPELLDYLTSEFVKSSFNTRHVMELICKSRTYQLSVETNKWNEDDQINFSHARARRLPAEVLYDAIYRTTGATSSFAGVSPGTRAATLPDVGVELPDGFLGNLGRPARESACECERSSNLQLGPVMALVSGPTVGNAISDPDNSIAKLVATDNDNSEVVKGLFLRFLNRPGKPDEVVAATAMFDQLEKDDAKLMADLAAYEKELGPKLAQKEIDRQNRIAGLQTELEAYRELAKLRGPRAEKERQQRIAKAQAAIAANDKKLVEKLPQFEKAQKRKAQWMPLDALEMDATYRARFARQPDGSIFVEADKATGAYHIVAPLPVDKLTGIRLEALADDRLPSKGPGRAPDGNFVVTEFAAHLLPAPGPMKLVRSWDFSGSDEGWKGEDGAKVIADSGMRHLFGSGKPAGMKIALKEPAGAYLLEVVTGVRSAVNFTVQWTTANGSKFEDSRTARRSLPAGAGGSTGTPVSILAESELTGLRIFVDDDQTVLPIDAVRLFAADNSGADSIKLKKTRATFSQAGYAIATAVDGNTTAAINNGWAIAPQLGRDHMATFSLEKTLEGVRNRSIELVIYQNFVGGQHSLGKFRLSVTSGPPLDFGLPASLAVALNKPAGKRTDADRQSLLAELRKKDKQFPALLSELAAAQQPAGEDSHMKELESQLALAQQAIPMDGKLQQMRRALELSREQLKNKRLTVAQDVAWALINNPSFLYNH
jgi:WD40 repeat protein/mono/diheme cytochrome c family protein